MFSVDVFRVENERSTKLLSFRLRCYGSHSFVFALLVCDCPTCTGRCYHRVDNKTGICKESNFQYFDSGFFSHWNELLTLTDWQIDRYCRQTSLKSKTLFQSTRRVFVALNTLFFLSALQHNWIPRHETRFRKLKLNKLTSDCLADPKLFTRNGELSNVWNHVHSGHCWIRDNLSFV